ncbi:hypothetical protein HYH03_013359 [Edaphochlamys debaryana]|uniref:Ancillary SecYEG translocon subunit/Cell division coordinator CpoB TPR domain-containing protein n=1 Tax=Edaphochlamys debaryana TaxID=47281 RepID=A0A835XR06_9CHLO|nr:hypothetical protein HYH03_013359 [Edaphochlamys debaryana]|eukprot:KAG2488055.1 hypothetical protein HYH03_013359 [Edaphochlamys debaryana]
MDAAALAVVMPLVRAIWQRAEASAAQQQYRGAAETLQQALILVPDPASAPHVATLLRLARLWLAAGNPGAGLPWALAAVEAAPEQADGLEAAGDCLREAGRPQEAAVHYQAALELLEEAGDGGETGGEQGGQNTGTRTGSGSGPADGSEQQLRLRLALATCLYDTPGATTPPYDNQDLAASLVMAVLEADGGNWEALRLYGRIAMDRGIRDDALRVALRIAVQRPGHAGAKQLLARCLADEEGCRLLFEELGVAAEASGTGTGPGTGTGAGLSTSEAGGAGAGGAGGSAGGAVSSAAALGFLATAIKDFGKVDSCIRLLSTAARLQPSNASYALNLAHARELRQDLAGAAAAAAAYCRANADSALAGLRLGDVAALLEALPPLPRASDLTWLGLGLGLGPDLGLGPEGAPDAKAAVGSGAGDALEEATDSLRRVGLSSGGEAAIGNETAVAKVAFTPDQLDELALLFTSAKVLFVGGALAEAEALCAAVEPVRRASAAELHTTLIRNEAAYFCCVRQLLEGGNRPGVLQRRRRRGGTAAGEAGGASRGDAAPQAAGAAAGEAAGGGGEPRPLYLIGDSHCLSAAWREVELRGERRLLRPLLVTGCKIWHLRPASLFYPKAQFEAAVALLPECAQAVLVLGEIDCREGLLLAVQKGKYDSVAEGIDATVGIYLRLLRELLGSRPGLELFLHPVPPVLNETRPIVVSFAAALKKAVAKARTGDPGVLGRRLHYLDFFDGMLVPPGTVLVPPGAEAAGVAAVADGAAAAAAAAGAAAGAGAAAAPAVAAAGAPALTEAARAAAAAAVAAAVPGEGLASWQLRPDLAFDGTHLAPAYLPLLDSALQRLD